MVISKKKKKTLHLNSVSYFSIFDPKARCSLQKKSFHRNLVTIFCSLIIVTVLKFLTLPKYVLVTAEKFQFCPNLRNLDKHFPSLPPSPAGTAMIGCTDVMIPTYPNVKIRTIN